MSVSLKDLQPEKIKVNIKGVELESKPVRLKHALVMAKVGSVFENPKQATLQDIERAQSDIDNVFEELIPELKGIELDISSTTDLLSQLMSTIEPDDNKVLSESGVKIDSDPKAQEIG